MGAVSPLRAMGRVVRYVAGRAFGESIAEGRLKENPAYPWPPGLRPVIIATWTLFVVLAGLAVAAGRLRGMELLADGRTSLPWLAVPVLCVAVATALALLYAAALHLWWVVRIPVVLLVALMLATAPSAGGMMLGVLKAVGVVVLLVFAGVRWRARFSPWEFVLALAVIGNLLILQLAGPTLQGFPGEAWALRVLTYWTGLLTILAVPAVLLASAAMTELVVRTGSWTARGVWEGLRTRPRGAVLGGVLLTALVVWSVTAEVWAIGTDPRRSVGTLPVALIIMAVTAAVALLVLRLAPRGPRPGVPIDPDDVADAYSPISWPLALVLTGWTFYPVLVTLVVSLFGVGRVDSDPGTVVMALVLLAAGLAIAVREARRDRPGRALIAVVFAVSTPVAQLLLLGGFATAIDQLIAVEVAAAVGLLGWLLIRRRLTAERALAIGTVLLLSRIHDFREILDDPLSAVLALSGASAVLLVGLVWRQLTEYAAARGDSARFPNAGRVLLALANMTLVTMSVAMFTLSAGDDGIVGLGVLESMGDSELGGALMHACMLAGLLLAWRGRESAARATSTTV